ncbi:exodeoxyribonuclease III [Candidatus Woesearchaeota archaeon]|nr:exodeoxyribonuclease III [Candidatus Woesearchaeota archaeon]
MEIHSWNVNGLRAVAKKGFDKYLLEYNPDVLCIQETKAQIDNLEEHHTDIGDYYSYFFSAQKKGYSGVAIYTKQKPLAVIKGIGIEKFDDEGRVLMLEFEQCFVASVYTPNAQHGLLRMDYRLEFEKELRAFAKKMSKIKPIFICGDLNVAHNEIDIKNAKPNMGNPGFTLEERGAFTQLLSEGFVDTFRTLHPDAIEYSWWSYRFSARARNIGWRIDYVVTSKESLKYVKEAFILPEVLGSDHCPVGVKVKF